MQIPMFYSKYTDNVYVAAGGYEEAAARDAEKSFKYSFGFIYFLVEIAPLSD